jgi:glycine cleavage system H protein
MNVPDQLKYTQTHEWADIQGDTAVVGVTDYAQKELGDIVFVECPKPGASVRQGEPCGSIEAVKTVSEIISPVSGEVAAVNPDLAATPQIVNQDPYGKGWFFKIKLSDASEAGKLMDAEAYRQLVG